MVQAETIRLTEKWPGPGGEFEVVEELCREPGDVLMFELIFLDRDSKLSVYLDGRIMVTGTLPERTAVSNHFKPLLKYLLAKKARQGQEPGNPLPRTEQGGLPSAELLAG